MVIAKYLYPENGYYPAEDLTVGSSYKVEQIMMGQSRTDISLKGYTKVFNSVQFEFFENGKPLDIYHDPRFNPYLRIHLRHEKRE